MKIPEALFIAVLFAALVLALGCVYGWYRNRKMYRTIDRMLDEILDGEPVSQSDIREGEISALAAKAKRIIEGIAKDVEVGQLYMGKVVRILPFGAFVELAPNKDGMVHISKLSDKRVGKVEDVVNIGDEVTVKVIEIDKMGRVNLSMKPADLAKKD